MTEREQLESAIREAFQIGKASANEHIAFSSTAIALEALIQRTAKQARATPALPEGMAIVPVEPTARMLDALYNFIPEKYATKAGETAAYKSMLAAAKESS